MQKVSGNSNSVVRKPRELDDKQLRILDLLYRFRFGTSRYLALGTGISKRTMDERLQRLYEHSWIDRRYDKSYRLMHKPAVYYLNGNGRATLRRLSKRYRSDVLRRLSRDATASERHINHWLTIFSVYATLRSRHGDNIHFYTANQLVAYDFFPETLPDAYIRLKLEGVGKERLFFLYTLLHMTRFKEATEAVFNLIDYVDIGVRDWAESTGCLMPRVLFLCGDDYLMNRLTRKIRRAVQGADAELLRIYVTTPADFTARNLWHDILDPATTVPLENIKGPR